MRAGRGRGFHDRPDAALKYELCGHMKAMTPDMHTLSCLPTKSTPLRHNTTWCRGEVTAVRAQKAGERKPETGVMLRNRPPVEYGTTFSRSRDVFFLFVFFPAGLSAYYLLLWCFSPTCRELAIPVSLKIDLTFIYIWKLSICFPFFVCFAESKRH